MAPADALVARLATERMGLLTRQDLLAAGASAKAIRHRLETGRLRAVHPGVYATGHAELTPEQRALAAVLACGPGAVLSHGSAAALWRLLPSVHGPPEVLYTGRRRAGPAGVRLHRTVEVACGEATTRGGVPVTSVARTLLDLAATGSAARLAIALDEARAGRLVTARELQALAAAGRRGSRSLRAVLAEAPGFTRSHAERRLRALLAGARLPSPRTNARVAGHELDLYWPREGYAVEVDGYAAHAGRAAFERDRRRDQDLAAHGVRVVRVTWRQLTHEPEAVVARLAAGLALASAQRGGPG